jgi:membrane protein DedA with SNARE-associated domain
MKKYLEAVVVTIVGVVGKLGYTGIVGMMFLESSFFPFPSEVVIPPGGYLASQGEMKIYLVIFCGILGSLLGAWFNYWLAVKLGRPVLLKYGRYVGITEEKFAKVEHYFTAHGEIGTFVGRLIPGIRQYISFPAGLARMNMLRFSLFTGLGAGIWVVILAYIGYIVGDNPEVVKQYSHQSSIYLVFFLITLMAVYIWNHKRKKANQTQPASE